MKRFKSIDVMGIPISITWDKDSMYTDSKEDYGEFTLGTRTININSELCKTPLQLEETLLHEIIHAVLGVSGQSEHLKGDSEEAIVRALEHGLAPVIRVLRRNGYFK